MIDAAYMTARVINTITTRCRHQTGQVRDRQTLMFGSFPVHVYWNPTAKFHIDAVTL